jgi:septal ring factor EnvC (AmiA/AmiB activator)
MQKIPCHTDPCACGVLLCSEEDRQFIQQSTESDLIQLFRSYDELCEQRQELENKLEENEDTLKTLP